MKEFNLIQDSFKNRMIVSVLAIFVLSIFNFWFVYRDHFPLRAALAAQTFYIDNQLSADCTNYVVATRSCGSSSGILAWSELKNGLLAIKALQDNNTIEIGGHTINIRSGTYYPNRVTTWPNGASDNKRNTIKGYSNEVPAISGAKILSNWQSVGNNIYSSADLLGTNRYLDVRDIYQDDVQLTEAEHPNNGAYYTIDARGDGSYIQDSELIALYNQSPELVLDATVEFLGRDLFGERHKIEYVNTQTGRAYFYASDVMSAAPYTSAIYHLIGKMEHLDQVGEFYYQTSADGQNGEVAYVKFAPGDNPTNYLLEIPDQDAFRFGYGSIQPAYYLNFNNLELKHGVQGVYLDGDRTQIVNYGNDFVHHITFDNVDSHDHARFGYILGGNAHHIVVKNSSIENNNLAGIYFVGFGKPICGNGVLDNWSIGSAYATNPEQCDDGNLINGDGCSAQCGLTSNYNGLAVEPWDDYYKAYITIDNNVIRNNKANGISYSYLANGVISNNTLEYNGAHSANSGIGVQRGSDTEIFNNSVSYQGGNGILIEGGVTEKARRYNIYNNTVRHSSYNNSPNISAYFGIWLDEADDINVHDNTFYNENGRGFAMGGTDNSQIVRNKFLDIFSSVVDSEYRYAFGAYIYDGEAESLSNNIIAHNIFAGKIKYGLNMFVSNPVTSPFTVYGNTTANNIFYSVRTDKVQMNNLIPNIDHSANVYDYNMYYAPNASSIVYNYENTEYATLEAFQSASNRETHSSQVNPVFVNFNSKDFHLQASSPAIDQALSLSTINDSYEGFGADIGVYEYASGPTCSNSLIEGSEECDDGNLTNGDGCSATCLIEEENLPPPPAPTCSDGIQNGSETGVDCGGSCNACSLEEPPPPAPTCSDGIQNGSETGVDCGGSCNACSLEEQPPEDEESVLPGQGGEGLTPGQGLTTPAVCGDLVIETGEQCDDGNTADNDGCSYLCQLEGSNTLSDWDVIEVAKLQGRLVKLLNDPRVYYINPDNQRYYIPNLPTFLSWFKNFRALEIIDAPTLSNYPYQGRLTVKPGNLVKFKDSKRVYVIEPTKTIRWITTGTIFKDFGYNFSKVINLPAEDFQYYTLGTALTSSQTHPNGQLLKHGGFAPVFYIKDNIEYWIKDESTFLALGFKWQDIITIPVRYWYTRVLSNLTFKLKDR